jgi:hypothetical protein
MSAPDYHGSIRLENSLFNQERSLAIDGMKYADDSAVWENFIWIYQSDIAVCAGVDGYISTEKLFVQEKRGECEQAIGLLRGRDLNSRNINRHIFHNAAIVVTLGRSQKRKEVYDFIR